MGRILSSVLNQVLENLDKDLDSHKSAMKALKLYVKDLDEKAISLLLAQVSEIKETGSQTGEYTVSLFEDLARVHGVKIAPYTETIMLVIIRTLACSAGSFPLQQACSKTVSAIARYGIDPGTPGDKKRNIIHSLCKPLSDSLVVSQEHLALGAVLCLKALVDCDNWRFASDEVVDMVCQNVVVALDECSNETDYYMALVIALAKRNPFIVEAYARLLVCSGLRILDLGVMEVNSQKRLVAIQMLNFLMKTLDPKSMYSELELIVLEMEKCQNDTMHFVKMAAYETMRTAKKMKAETDSEFDRTCDSVTGSSFSRGSHNRSITGNPVGRSITHMPPEFEDFHSFPGFHSPSLRAHASYGSGDDRWSVSHNKHRSYANGQADDDDLFSGVANGFTVPCSPLVPYGDYMTEFTGCRCEGPQRSQSCDEANDMNSKNMNFEFRQSGNLQTTGSRRGFGRNTKLHPKEAHHRHNQHGFMHDSFDELRENSRKQYSDGSDLSEGPAESISSSFGASTTTTTTTTTTNGTCLNFQAKSQTGNAPARKGKGKSVLRLGLSFFSMAVAGFASYVWVYVQDDVVPHLVPT